MVRWLGCVQSQDYGPAKWSLGERSRGAMDADVDRAMAEGAILRTHVLRPTWHFVLPADIRWIQALTASRVHAQNAYYYRQTGLDDGVRTRARRLIVEALRGGSHLTRKELEAVLQRAADRGQGAGDGVHADGRGAGLRGLQRRAEGQAAHVRAVRRAGAGRAAALPRRGAGGAGRPLLHQPRAGDGQGPALLVQPDAGRHPARDRDRGRPRLEREEIDGRAFWSAPGEAPPPVPSPAAHLLQGLDEYFVGYGESRGYCDRCARPASLVDRAIYNGAVVIDTQLAGHWKRTVDKRAVSFQLALYAAPDEARMDVLRAAADAQGAFLGLAAELEIVRT